MQTVSRMIIVRDTVLLVVALARVGLVPWVWAMALSGMPKLVVQKRW